MTKVDRNALQNGQSVHTLSKQWALRPPDERYLSINDLHAATRRFAATSREHLADSSRLRVNIDEDMQHVSGDSQAGLTLAGEDGRNMLMSNWAFGQTCSRYRLPGAYLRTLPAKLAGVNLQYAITADTETEGAKMYVDHGDSPDSFPVLRALTSPTYGRIYDHEVVSAVKSLTESSAIEWKVPGALDWGSMTYNPDMPVTLDSTTLYASDRDVFMFLCADKAPIEIGKLANGEPDLVFRGFYVRNSEVGRAAFSIATMYFRAVCCNRILWGVENFNEITFKHTRGAPGRFLNEVAPALQSYAAGSTMKLVDGVQRAKSAIVADSDEKRVEFLRGRGLSVTASNDVIDSVLMHEGHPAVSVWDMVQGITRVSQKQRNADDRLDMERVAGKILEKV
jgi:hypothetical protein